MEPYADEDRELLSSSLFHTFSPPVHRLEISAARGSGSAVRSRIPPRPAPTRFDPTSPKASVGALGEAAPPWSGPWSNVYEGQSDISDSDSPTTDHSVGPTVNPHINQGANRQPTNTVGHGKGPGKRRLPGHGLSDSVDRGLTLAAAAERESRLAWATLDPNGVTPLGFCQFL